MAKSLKEKLDDFVSPPKPTVAPKALTPFQEDQHLIASLHARIKELEAELQRHKNWASRQKRTIR